MRKKNDEYAEYIKKEFTMESTEDQETGKKENPLTKAKTWSLISKIIGSLIIILGFILKWTGKLPEATDKSILACGFGVMGIFGTVDLNIVLEKFTK